MCGELESNGWELTAVFVAPPLAPQPLVSSISLCGRINWRLGRGCIVGGLVGPCPVPPVPPRIFSFSTNDQSKTLQPRRPVQRCLGVLSSQQTSTTPRILQQQFEYPPPAIIFGRTHVLDLSLGTQFRREILPSTCKPIQRRQPPRPPRQQFFINFTIIINLRRPPTS